MKKIKRFIIIFIVLAFNLSLSQCNLNNKKEPTVLDESKNEEKLLVENDLSAEDLVKRSIKLMNDHNKIELIKCYTKDNELNNFRLENLKSIKLIDISFEEDIRQYESYISTLKSSVDINDLKIYNVKYDIKYLDESNEPIKNGINVQQFFVIKQSNGEWKISGVASM